MNIQIFSNVCAAIFRTERPISLCAFRLCSLFQNVTLVICVYTVRIVCRGLHSEKYWLVCMNDVWLIYSTFLMLCQVCLAVDLVSEPLDGRTFLNHVHTSGSHSGTLLRNLAPLHPISSTYVPNSVVSILLHNRLVGCSNSCTASETYAAICRNRNKNLTSISKHKSLKEKKLHDIVIYYTP